MRYLAVVLAVVLQTFSPSSVSASAVSLFSAASTVPLAPAQSAALSKRLEVYFQACHPYGRVVSGDDLPQDTLAKLWADQENIVHVVLQVAFGPEAPPHLRDETLEILFGFPAETDGLGLVLARDPNRRVTSYIKCPGLEGLLLACHIHSLVPGGTPGSRCPKFEAHRPSSRVRPPTSRDAAIAWAARIAKAAHAS